MPELIEVEAYRSVAERTVGRRIAEVRAPDDWFLKRVDATTLAEVLVGRTVTGTRRRGKLLLLDTDGPVLGLRFGMTGRLLVDGAGPIERLLHSSERDLVTWHRFGLGFDGGGALSLVDPRRLGAVELDPDEGRLGPDAATVGRAALRDALGSSTAPLKARLMDQSRLAGLGNLLTDEILWRAELDPRRAAGELDGEELDRLSVAIDEVLRELGERGGSHTGDLQEHRTPGGVCPRDGTALRRDVVGGRTTWWCPAHQR